MIEVYMRYSVAQWKNEGQSGIQQLDLEGQSVAVWRVEVEHIYLHIRESGKACAKVWKYKKYKNRKWFSWSLILDKRFWRLHHTVESGLNYRVSNSGFVIF